jgi:hypothetical protein
LKSLFKPKTNFITGQLVYSKLIQKQFVILAPILEAERRGSGLLGDKNVEEGILLIFKLFQF